MDTARGRQHTRSGEGSSSCGAARMRVTWANSLACSLPAPCTTLSTCLGAPALLRCSSGAAMDPASFLRRHLPMDPSPSTQTFTTSTHTNLCNPSITQQGSTTSRKSTVLLLNSPVPHTRSLQPHHMILFEGYCSCHYHQHLITIWKGRSWDTLDLWAVQPSAQTCTMPPKAHEFSICSRGKTYIPWITT